MINLKAICSFTLEAQRFPWDYNGIVAGSPDMDEVDLALRLVWNARQFLAPTGQPILTKWFQFQPVVEFA